MENIAHIFWLALVQGITEFLPISSSAHLVLLPKLLGWQDQGLMVDVATHVGTLGAVVVYFHREALNLCVGGVDFLCRRKSPHNRLFALVALASLPVFVAGFLMKSLVAGELRAMGVIAATTLIFGVLLGWADRKAGKNTGTLESLSPKSALIIGLAQAVALVPGTSRSGITMTAGLLCGLSRAEGARFSMLLAIPTILAAGGLAGWELYRGGNATVQSEALLAAGLSFITALAAIALLMRWLRKSSFMPFVIYRLILAIFLIFYLF